MRRRWFAVALIVLCTALFGSAALAATTEAYTAEAFAAAQAANRPILVEITAPWCPTCEAQRPLLADLTSQPKFRDLAIFTVDFDSQRDVVRSMHADMQSTLVTYKGSTEVSRSVGVTSKIWLAKQLDKLM